MFNGYEEAFSRFHFFFALALAGADVSGKWSGTAEVKGSDGEPHVRSAFAVFKQAGTEVTGTIGPSEQEQYPIGKGSAGSGKFTFEMQVELDSGPQTLKAEFRVSGAGKMEGTIAGFSSGPVKLSLSKDQ